MIIQPVEVIALPGVGEAVGAPPNCSAVTTNIAVGLALGGTLRSWVIEGVSAGRKETVWVQFFGQSVKAKLITADETGFTAQATSAAVPVSWKEVDPEKLHAMAQKYADVEGLIPKDRAEVLEVFAKAYGFDAP